MSATDIASVSSEVDIFAYRPFQTSWVATIEIAYKSIALEIITIWNFLYLTITIPTYVSISNSLSGVN